MIDDFDKDARFRVLVRLPGDTDGHSVYSSDDIEDIDSKIEELRFEGLPEGTFVYTVAGVRRDRPSINKYGVERPRTRQDLGVRTIVRSRVFEVQGGDLVKTGWKSTRSY